MQKSAVPRTAIYVAWMLAAIAGGLAPFESAQAQNFWDNPAPRKAKSKARPAAAAKPAAAQPQPTIKEATEDAAKVEASKSKEADDARAAAQEAKDAAKEAEDARAAAKEAKDAAKAAGDAAAAAKKAATKVVAVPEKPKEVVIPVAAKSDADPVVAAAFNKLAEKNFTARSNKDDVDAAKVFYGERSGPGLWTAPDGLNAKAKAVISEINKADDWGLDAKAFELPQLASGQTTPDALGEAEAKLTLAALKYARHARGGRIDPLSLSRIWDQAPPVRDPAKVLEGMAVREEADSYLRGLHPKHEQFKRLREVLLKARGPSVKEESSDPVFQYKIPKGASLKPGAEHADVAILRQRLKVPPEAGAKDTLYDPKLVEAVKAYQKDRGLEAGGLLNQATRSALNSEGEAKKPNPTRDTQRLVLNMERWRWMPEDLGSFYVWDNVPEYVTRIMKDDKQTYIEKIIVGQPTWPTPVFSADMLYIVFHPEWGMPDGIKLKELKPRLQQSGGGFFDQLFGGGGGNVIRAYGLRVSYNGHPVDPDSVDWSNANLSNYSFVQPAGAKNPLGIVKFRFPNKHDVYMHDTPERELFARSQRNLSHGCMRVQNPIRFAEVLLEHDKGWSAGRVGGALNSGGEVALERPIPVHVTYFTAMVDENGRVSTFGDIYGHDSRLASALGGKPIYYEAPPEDPVAASDTVASGDPSSTGALGGKNKKGKKAPDTVQDIISSVFLN